MSYISDDDSELSELDENHVMAHLLAPSKSLAQSSSTVAELITTQHNTEQRTQSGRLIKTPIRYAAQAKLDEIRNATAKQRIASCSVSESALFPGLMVEAKARQPSKAIKNQRGPLPQPLTFKKRAPSVSVESAAPNKRSRGSKETKTTTKADAISKTPRKTIAFNTIISPPRTPHDSINKTPRSPKDTVEEELPVDAVLLEIHNLLTHREPIDLKPLPQGKPAVWATGRDELCETLPYYQSYRSGCYMKDGTVFSFMLDGTSHIREYMDENVVICRAGGSMSTEEGQSIQIKDHSIHDVQPQAVLNNLRSQNPLIIICGNKSTASITAMPQRYCVLGWYKPTHVWAEKVLGKRRAYTTIKYRFERLDKSSSAWYAPQANILTQEQEQAIPQLEIHQCQSCKQTYPIVMLSGWICLNESCGEFWKSDGILAPCNTMKYHPSFLRHTHWPSGSPPFDITPALPDPGQQIGDNLVYINTRGVVCPQCGRCNARYLWVGWKCDSCDWTLRPLHRVVSVSNLSHQAWNIPGYGPAVNKSTLHSSVEVEVAHTHHYTKFSYTIPGIEGTIILLKANRVVVEEENGPNDMFRALQTEDIGLVRRLFKQEQLVSASIHESKTAEADSSVEATPISGGSPPTKGVPSSSQTAMAATIEDTTMQDEEANVEYSSGRMKSFSMNFGMPYKFVAGGESRSFDDASWVIRAARSRLNWAARECGSKVDFNELLALGYLEGQKINYHDDGEAGLGPVIATLSLGAPATMKLKLKAKYFCGVSKSGCFTYQAPMSLELLAASGANLAAEQYQRRIDGFTELHHLKTLNKGDFNKRSRELATELELKHAKAKPLLGLHIMHGDIVIMQGEEIQKYLEHAVEPHGALRFALTCRHILPHHLTKDEQPPYDVLPDTYGYDGSKLAAAAEASIR